MVPGNVIVKSSYTKRPALLKADCMFQLGGKAIGIDEKEHSELKLRSAHDTWSGFQTQHRR